MSGKCLKLIEIVIVKNTFPLTSEHGNTCGCSHTQQDAPIHACASPQPQCEDEKSHLHIPTHTTGHTHAHAHTTGHTHTHNWAHTHMHTHMQLGTHARTLATAHTCAVSRLGGAGHVSILANTHVPFLSGEVTPERGSHACRWDLLREVGHLGRPAGSPSFQDRHSSLREMPTAHLAAIRAWPWEGSLTSTPHAAARSHPIRCGGSQVAAPHQDGQTDGSATEHSLDPAFPTLNTLWGPGARAQHHWTGLGCREVGSQSFFLS